MPKLTTLTANLIRIPPNMAAAGWDIDVDILRAFCAANGIKRNIKIRFNSSFRTGGTHRGREINGKLTHCITVSQVLSRKEAMHVILHELCHAIQAENFATDEEFHKEYTRYVKMGARDYQLRNPFEIEAEDFAANNLEKWDGLLY